MSAARSVFAVVVGITWLVLAVALDATTLSPSSSVPRHARSDMAKRPERIARLFTLTPESDDFTNGVATLDPANAYDNVYTVHYFVTVTINGSSSQYGGATLVIGIETNDGSGWVERAAPSHSCSYLSGPPPWATRTCSWSHEQQPITVSGLGVNDQIRLVTKSFTTSNGAGGSYGFRGGDGAGPNPETYNGVTYTTDIIPVTASQWDDFPSGNYIGAVGATAETNLNPGGAYDNVYTVHFFVTATINANPTTYGSAQLVIAVETNHAGGAWVERATYNYNCGYPSGPPPYSAYTCNSWTHEQQVLTITGLGLNDGLRLKAKSFTTSNGAGGSFGIRGGDGGGVNPETYNGITYTTYVVRGVAVRSELSDRQGFAGASASQRFFVKNRGDVDGNLSLSFSCAGVLNCAVTPTTFASMQPGESRVATLTYTLGTAGTTGTGMVKAFDNFDNNVLRDSAVVVTKAIGAPAPVVSFVDVNPETAVQRDQCLTVPAGSAAANECGDLRIMHALPRIRTVAKVRAPILLYNSALADPYPIVAANVTLASGSPVPDSVEAVLTVGGAEKARARWAGSDWAAGSTRRIALGYSANADTTKVYDYTFEVATVYLPNGRNGTTVNGKVIVVNRRGGGFGAGWWLVGLERLELLADGSKLWISGDGSARLFTAASANVWVAARVDRPDTLTWDGTYYVRKLPGALQIKFNSAGQHVLTVSRLGHQTSFAYTNGLLTSITLPSQGGGQTYALVYDGNGQLSSVTAPGGRVTTAWVSALRVDSLRDPDNGVTRFTYENGSSRRVATRVDRRGATTMYNYDAAEKLWRVKLNLQPDSIRVGFRARDVIGLATATPKTATDTANVYTSLFGARQFATGANYIAQETKVWLDRYGAARRMLDPLNNETVMRREDGEWSDAATEVQVANGFLTRTRYDGRGNVTATVGVDPLSTGQDAITRYHWDRAWDLPDSVVTPTGIVTVMGYSGVNGNQLWQQVGTDPARRVNFRYGNTLGLRSSTVLPGTPPDSIEYDVMGNVAVVRTPKGYETRYTRDGIGRDTMIQARIDTATAIYQTVIARFDLFDHDTLQRTIGPPLSGVSAETVFVRRFYDATGHLDSLLHWANPDRASLGVIRTKWVYDLAGRPRREIATDGRQEAWTFDPAGNMVADSTRRSHIITMTYTALNQLATRVLPPVSYASRNSNITQPPQTPYPAYQIAGETQTFTYTALGQLATADNPYAKVKRTYYRGGLLERDSSWIQTVALDDWTRHVYGVLHTYDLEGRQTSVNIPVQLGDGGLWQDISFGYDTQTGMLNSVSDLHHDSYAVTYNNRSEPATILYPSQYRESFTYDGDGRLASDTLRNLSGTAFPRLPATVVRGTTFRYDAQGRLVRTGDPTGGDPYGYRDTLNVSYSGLGHIRTSRYGMGWEGSRSAAVETFTFDPLGNRTFGETYDSSASSYHYTAHTSTYQPSTGRITVDGMTGGPTNYFYDWGGNTEFVSNTGSQWGPAEERADFYTADGRLRASDWRWVANPTQFFSLAKYDFDEYRYDALGRRVWVWSKKSCANEGNPWWEAVECKTSLVRRTIWDGNREFIEIQMPGGSATEEVALYENDQAAVQLANLPTQVGSFDRNQYFGRVVYIPGRGVDQPFAITRINYAYQHDIYGSPIAYKVVGPFTIMPFWTSGGDARLGVFSNGARLICNPPTAQTDCVGVVWSPYWSAFDRHFHTVWDNWNGTILESRRDKTNISYSRSRYYDPQTGRFTQEDPIGLAGGLNLYGFAGGDPVNFVDPFGTSIFSFLKKWAGVALGFAVLVATGGLGGAILATLATAAGSAVFAGVESLITGEPFWDAFRRNFNLSEAFLGGSALVAEWFGGGVVKVGANGLFQGYVQSANPILGGGGLTFGSGSIFTGVAPKNPLSATLTYGMHELGHTVQYAALSFLGKWTPLPYLALGGFEVLYEKGWWDNPIGKFWYNSASTLGGIASW